MQPSMYESARSLYHRSCDSKGLKFWVVIKDVEGDGSRRGEAIVELGRKIERVAGEGDRDAQWTHQDS